MNIKVIKTNEMEQYLYPDGIETLEQFVSDVVMSNDDFVEMQYLNDDAGTAPFFVRADIKTVYVNFKNITTIEEDEVMLLTDAEFEEQLAPFTYDICTGCAFDGNPDVGCDRILTKRDKIDIIEETCFLYADGDEYEIEPPKRTPFDKDQGKIYDFRRDRKKHDD